MEKLSCDSRVKWRTVSSSLTSGSSGGCLRLKLAGMSPDVYEVFELLEFQNILEAYDSAPEAVQRFESELSGGMRRAADG